MLATAPDHPFADRRRVRVRDLDGLDLVMFREGYDLRAVTLAACLEAEVQPRLVSEGGEMAGVLAFVASGLGAAVVPAIALPRDGSLVGIPFTGTDHAPHRRPGPAWRPHARPSGPCPRRPARDRRHASVAATEAVGSGGGPDLREGESSPDGRAGAPAPK